LSSVNKNFTLYARVNVEQHIRADEIGIALSILCVSVHLDCIAFMSLSF